MLTRLLLLGALLLGMIAPLSAGPGAHCRRPGSMGEMTGMPHHPASGLPEHSRHAPQGCEHCPPAECAAVTACAPGTLLSDLTVAPMIGRPTASSLTLRTSNTLRGRDLEPPTPPPNRSL